MAHTDTTDMGFLDKLADWLAPSNPSVPSVASAASTPDLSAAQHTASQFAPVPSELPRISARSAAELCKECKPDPAALLLLNPQQTPAQFLAVLQERNLGSDMVKVLAQGLPDHEGVAWAVKCALKVVDKLPAADALAMRAAEAWLKNPTAERQAAAAAAAQRTDFQGPGAWAAQAAAWAKTGAEASDPTLSGPPEAAPLPRLTPQAVSAAVLLSATILARPEYATRKLQVMQMAIGAVAGIGVGNASIPHVPGASGHLQGPTIGMPAGPTVPNASMPQLPGAAGKVQAAIPAMQSVGGMAASGASLPAMAGAVASAAGVGGAVPGAISDLGAAAHGGGAGFQSGAMGGAHGGVSGLQNAAHALAGGTLPNVVPNAQMPSLSPPNFPQMPPPTVPPAVREFVFREQQPFIRIGLEIASGAIPLA